MNKTQEENSGSGFDDFKIVNEEFQKKKDKLLSGKKIDVKDDPIIANKMKSVLSRMHDAEEGYVEIDDNGNEKVVQERPKSNG